MRRKSVEAFLDRQLRTAQTVKLILPALSAVDKEHEHLKKVAPLEKARTCLPLVHIMTGNMKKFINGTFHGVSSHYLQEYLDEFCHLFNSPLKKG